MQSRPCRTDRAEQTDDVRVKMCFVNDRVRTENRLDRLLIDDSMHSSTKALCYETLSFHTGDS